MAKDTTRETVKSILEAKKPSDDVLTNHFRLYRLKERSEEDAELERLLKDLRSAKRKGGQAIKVARSRLHDYIVQATSLNGFKSPLNNRKEE